MKVIILRYQCKLLSVKTALTCILVWD